MKTDLDTSFRWPAVDERFAAIALSTVACFSLFLQILDRQPPPSDKGDLLALFSQANAPLPHNLGLTWSELMVELGCTGTDPNAPLCEAIAEEERRSKDQALASYRAEAKRRAGSFAPAKIETYRVMPALDALFSDLGSRSKRIAQEQTERMSKPCSLASSLCPALDLVHVACAKQVAPRNRVTGAISVHIVAVIGKPPIVTVAASTISNRAVERCIVAKLGR